MSTVKMVACSTPVGDLAHLLSAENLVAYTARVSNPANQENQGTAPRLLRYLVNNSHWSPFEMVSVTMEINTTRDIARQILRHRSFSFQEFSQRYADPTDELGFEFREARLQDKTNRQNSIETDDDELTIEWNQRQAQAINAALRAYDWAIANGIAREQARAVLPEGNTGSRLYMAGTLRSWIHYCDLRMYNGTQKEHIEIATKCWDLICEQFPSIKEALDGE